jgi:hypothetical protein
MKVIIAGGRFFDDYDLLKKKVSAILKNATNITIISGAAKGADTLGENYGYEMGYEVISMPANWEKYGKSAGYRRNEDMAKIADACICFWDGESRGTGHMINLAKQYNLQLRVIRYDKSLPKKSLSKGR